MRKRVLSVFLSLIMVIGLLPVSALAAGNGLTGVTLSAEAGEECPEIWEDDEMTLSVIAEAYDAERNPIGTENISFAWYVRAKDETGAYLGEAQPFLNEGGNQYNECNLCILAGNAYEIAGCADFYCVVTCGDATETVWFYPYRHVEEEPIEEPSEGRYTMVIEPRQRVYNVNAGDTITMAVSAYVLDAETGDHITEGIEYNWYRVDVDEEHEILNGDWSPIEGAETNTYTATAEIGFDYVCSAWCEMEDEWANDDVVFEINVAGPRLIAVADTDSAPTVLYGDELSMAVDAYVMLEDETTTVDGVTCQWYRQPMTLNANGWPEESGDPVLLQGETGSGLTVASVTTHDHYFCRVAYQTQSRDIWFYVDMRETELLAERVGWVDGMSLVRLYGNKEMAVSACYVDHGVRTTEGITYQWAVWDNDSMSYTNIEGATQASYTAEEIDEHREYCCYVMYMTQQVNKQRELYFNIGIDEPVLVMDAQGSGYITGTIGQMLTLSAHAYLQYSDGAEDSEEITYQWYVLDETENGSFYAPIADAMDASFTIEAVPEGTTQLKVVADYAPRQARVERFFTVYGEEPRQAELIAEGYDRWPYVQVHGSMTMGVNAYVTLGDGTTTTEGIEYQWYRQPQADKNGGAAEAPDPVLLVGETGADCTVTDVTDASDYYCEVSWEDLSMEVWFYPSLDNGFNVDAITPRTVRVIPGNSVTMEVSATAYDESHITYQWYRSVTNANGGTDYVAIEGATGASYTVASVTEACEYRVDVSDGYQSWPSCVWFSVSLDNNFWLHAVNGQSVVRVAPGGTATLQVYPTGYDLTDMVYLRWEKSPYAWPQQWEEVQQPTEPGDTLVTDPVRAPAYYRCVARDRFGNEASMWFDILVENHLSATPVGGSDKPIAPGREVTLEVAVTADDMNGITYAWTIDGQSFSDVGGSSLTLKTVDTRKEVFCTVTDAYGNECYVYFNVYVDNGFSVTRVGPQVVKVAPGGSATLAVIISVQDDEDMTISWSGTNLEDETGTSVTIENVSWREWCSCTVTDKYGNSETIDFIVTVDSGLFVEGAGRENYVYVEYGGNVTLAPVVTVNDNVEVTYWWEGDDLNQGESDPTCTVENVTERKHYTCFINDDYGNEVRVEYVVCVQNDFAVARVGDYERFAQPGGDVTLAVTVSGTDVTDVSYRWERLTWNEDGYWNYGSLENNSATLAIRQIGAGARYICIATDRFGNYAEVSFLVTVGDGLTAERVGEEYRYVTPGTDATLAVSASGGTAAAGLSYQWYTLENHMEEGHHGEGGFYEYANRITGATGASYTVENVFRGQHLMCVVSDAYGNCVRVDFYVGPENGFTVTPVGGTERTASVGGSAELAVTASATGGTLTYYWLEERICSGEPYLSTIQDANGASFTETDIRQDETIVCLVMDDYGNMRRVTFHITVGSTPLAILTQPVNFVGAIGDTATFTVAAEGDGLTYQWQHHNGTKWVNSGATGNKTATLSIGVTETRLKYRYRCILTDSRGNTMMTDEVKMVLPTPLAILTQPVDFVGAIGDTATFTVVAEGDGLTYQWQVNAGSGWANSGAASANEATLKPGKVTEARLAYLYRCIITDSRGNTVTTNEVRMVLPAPALTIVTQPKDFEGEIGATASFTVAAEGDGLTYQWQVNAGSGWANSGAASANDATLKPGKVTEARLAYLYRCIITDSRGNTVTTNEVRMVLPTPALTIVTQPVDFEGEIGTMAIFTIEAEGDALAYQWQVNAGNGWANSGGTGNQTTTFKAGKITEARLNYRYRCIVTDGQGNEIISSEVKMVLPAAALTIVTQPTDYVGAIGASASFTVEATGDGLTYQWQVNAGNGWANSGAASANEATLKPGKVTEVRLAYLYRCIITDSHGNTVTTNEVRMMLPAAITILAQPVDFIGALGATASFTVEAEGDGLTYQWQVNSGNGWANSGAASANDATLKPGKVTEARLAYWYRCIITDSHGNTVTTNEVRMVLG